MASHEEGIKSVIGGLLDSINKDNADLANQFNENESVNRAVASIRQGDPDGFYFDLIYPLSNFVSGLVDPITKNDRVSFIFKHLNYVQNQFRKLIEKYEGSACSADKERTVMRALVSYYMTGKKIEWDLSGKYTFGIPKKVFTTHDEIVNFFEGVFFLYYGNPQKYLEAYSKIVLKQTSLELGEENE